MYIQVQNTTLSKNNQFRATKGVMLREIKSRGWRIADCKFTELAPELVKNKYQSPDGKNVGGVNRL